MTERTSLKDVLALNDPRKSLEALRDRIAEELDGIDCCKCDRIRIPTGAETAALTLRLMKVIEALESIPDGKEVSNVAFLRDQLAERRSRQSTAPDPAQSAKGQ